MSALARLHCLSFWQKKPSVQETMINDKGICHFESPENTGTPACLILYRSVVRTISMNKPVKYLALDVPEQNCCIQEKEPSWTTLCLLDNIRYFCRSDLPQRRLPGDPRQQILLIFVQMSDQIWDLFAWLSYSSLPSGQSSTWTSPS